MTASNQEIRYPGARTLTPSRLAQYVTRNRCERYMRLFLFPKETDALRNRYHARYEGLSQVMSESGNVFERDRVNELRQTEHISDLMSRDAAAFIHAVKTQPPGRVFYSQPRLEGRVGAFACEGRADLVRVERHADGSIDALVIDLKASRRETVGFRLQVAFYARLLADTLDGAGLRVNSIQGAIAARDDEFSADGLRTFDLALYLDEIERLVAAPDSDVARAASASLETASYHLGHHCDGCPYNALCFIETAERGGLALVPLLSATEKSALESEGVRSARDLAELFVYGDKAMQPAPGRESDIKRISSRWPLGSRLPALAQRARAALRRQDAATEARSFLLGSDYGSLPDEEQCPGLIKVFLDAQRDHIEDRLYVIACLIVGPDGEAEIVEMTSGPPDDEAERGLLVRWLQRALPAVASVTAAESAPVHVYLYDRRGQQALLDAMARHFDALCAIPAFYDLLTSTPALTQSMVSFLDDEVSARLNLGKICQNLYQVADELGFRWEHDALDFRRLFRARVFDTIQAFRRDPTTGQLARARGETEKPLWVETAARFGTQIPLEYAYAAWGRVAEPAYQVEPDHLREFALHRCRALRHVEERFKYKSRNVKKQPLDLSRLDQVEIDPADVPLHRSLEDFLHLERYATLQERLLHLALPPELRAETGRTAILRCDSIQGNKERVADFTIVDGNGVPLRTVEAEMLRLGEGDWVVLNPLMGEDDKPLTGWKLVRGRLATIEEVGAGRVRLRLLAINFKNSKFRFSHHLVDAQPGALYTLDEMADDLNADKFLEACQQAAANHVYQWLSDPEEGKRPRPIRPKLLRAAAEKAAAIAALAVEAQAPHGLTAAQREVVGGHTDERILVLQGPPGTGKSHTLGFAVLARMLAFAAPPRPFRVAVAARTHAATMIALESITKRAGDLLRAHPNDERLAPLRKLKVAKITNGPGESGSDAVEYVSESKQFKELLAEPLLVVGGTPGGIYNMMKRGASKKGKIDWTEKHFDLVVVDEASQMGIAEALTASAFLRMEGQFIAIGDHRQMPPILAHAWDQESRRDLSRARPHLSIFEYLRELGFTSAALDQSFRIPAEIADFLHRHVYAEDGIEFHSRNRERLDAAPGLAGWLWAALAPEYPLVIIEHDEAASQRENRFEAKLIEQIVRVAIDRLGLDAGEGVGIVVPHRAQKFLLRSRLPQLAEAIDTVERFQGGERDLMIVSATVSDREFAMLESGFLLEPRRLTVAISRPKKKLVVVASRAVFDLIPGDLDEYERGALWKYLRHECGGPALWEGEVDGRRVSVRAMR